jgi:hypothetical protein
LLQIIAATYTIRALKNQEKSTNLLIYLLTKNEILGWEGVGNRQLF